MGCTRKSRSFNCHRKSSTAKGEGKTSDIGIGTAENGDVTWRDWPVIALVVLNKPFIGFGQTLPDPLREGLRLLINFANQPPPAGRWHVKASVGSRRARKRMLRRRQPHSFEDRRKHRIEEIYQAFAASP